MRFFFNDTATTEIYTLSLHDALPISAVASGSPRSSPRRAHGWLRWGPTNRTRLSYYELSLAALEPARRVIVLRVHASNFRTVGFVESVEIEDLCRLGVPVVDDLGSGALADGIEALGDEPDVRRSIRAGVALACCSGDKLLGG